MTGGGSDKNEAAARLGIPVDLVEEADGFEEAEGIYPDNYLAASFFEDMQTQWRTGFAGLDYTALRSIFCFRRIKLADQADIFDDLKIMERAAIKAMRK